MPGRSPTPEARRIANSVVLFCVTSIVVAIVRGFLLDGWIFDVSAIVLLFMGYNLRNGFRKSIVWPAVFCGGYCLLTASVAITLLVAPERGRYKGSPIDPESPIVPTYLAISTVFCVWSGYNLRGLLKHRDGFVNMTDRLWSEEAEDEPVIQE